MNKPDVIVAATTNKGKISEIKAIMKEFGIEVISRGEAGVPKDLDIPETGDTFEENSMIKAKAIMELTGKTSIADDSGLCVDFLDGAPGVYSSRFAGEEGNDDANNAKLLSMMKDVSDEFRTARFISVVTMVDTEGNIIVGKGKVEGRLTRELKGSNGFGYDPMFMPEGFGETFGELPMPIKNKLSHRANALGELRQILLEKDFNEG